MNVIKSNYPPFTEVKVSNAVGILTLNKKLNLYPIFRLCTLNGIGNISYLSYQMHSRGVKVKEKIGNKKCKKCWKNGLNIEIDKNISIKLSNNKIHSTGIIHFTGIKSKEHAIDCFNKLRVNLDDVEDTLIYMNKNMEIAKKCIDFIKEIVKGVPIYVVKGSNILINPIDIIIHEQSMYVNITSEIYKKLELNKGSLPERSIKGKMLVPHSQNYITYLLISVDKKISLKSIDDLSLIPKGLSPKLIKFFLDKMRDFYCYESYILNLEWFLDIKSLYLDISNEPKSIDSEITNKLEYSNFSYGNNNYNYNMGFNVKLSNVSKLFDNNCGFISEYNNDVSKFVKVSLSMEIPEDLSKSIRKKKNLFFHKFIVYKTGSITQSGPHPELNKIAYDKFMNIIVNNIDNIKKIAFN